MDHLLRKPEAGVLLNPSLHFFFLFYNQFTFYTDLVFINSESFSVIGFLNVRRHNLGASKFTVILAPLLKWTSSQPSGTTYPLCISDVLSLIHI